MSNIYKPRLKICYQTKNKVWIYKNSRLRKFYNIRHKVILRNHWSYKKTIATKNMKWTVARRTMVPYNKKRINFLYNYKNTLYLKQQLKNFYGKIREYQLRNIFKQSWNQKQSFKRNVFISSLEQRLDMVVYRTRVLPTIFSCHQLIDHQGVFVNNELITIPGYRIKIGDIVSLKKNFWVIFYNIILKKLKKRLMGKNLSIKRKYTYFTTFQRILKKKKYFFKKKYHFFFETEYKHNLKKLKYLNKYLIYRIKYLKKFNSKGYTNDELEITKNLRYWVVINIYRELKIIKLNLNKYKFRKNKRKFLKAFNFFLKKIYKLNKIFLIINHIIKKEVINQRTNYLINTVYKNNTIPALNKAKMIASSLDEKINYNKDLDNKFKEKNSLLIKQYEKFLMKFHRKIYKLNYNSNINENKIRYKFGIYHIKQLKYLKKKKNNFLNKSFKHHWYTPNYLEVDYKTLRTSFIRYPKEEEVVYGFSCSFNQIISFYKEHAL